MNTHNPILRIIHHYWLYSCCSYHQSMQYEEVCNVIFHQGVDRPCKEGVDNPSPEVDHQYDIVLY